MTTTKAEQEQFSVPVGPNIWKHVPHVRRNGNLGEVIAGPTGVFLTYMSGALVSIYDPSTDRDIPKPPSYGPEAPIHIILHNAADRSERNTIRKVYFIGGDHGAIKIGYSVNPQDRLAAIQSCSPIPLSILATRKGGADREAAYHTQFAAHRLHGEWFKPHPDILAEITRIRSKGEL